MKKRATILCCVFLFGFGISALAQEDNLLPRAVLQKALVAHGGRNNMRHLERIYFRVNAKVRGRSASVERFVELPGRAKQIIRIEQNGQNMVLVRVIDEGAEWQKINNEDSQLRSEAEIKETQHGLYQFRVRLLYPLLDEKQFMLSNKGEYDVQGQKTVCVTVRSAARNDIDLYFDQKTGLLAKQSSKGIVREAADKTIEYYYSDYKTFHGVKLPTKTSMNVDGQRLADDELVECRTVKEFPKDTFVKP